MTTRTENLIPAQLDATNRCDNCSAQAKQVWRHPQLGELIFCDHHGNKQAKALSDAEWERAD